MDLFFKALYNRIGDRAILTAVTALTFILLSVLAVSAQDLQLKILEQPLPPRPKNFNTLDAQGTIVVRAEFMDFGQIGEVIVVTNELPRELTDPVIEAVRQIKFEPEKKDGKPVTIRRQLSYYYSWNGGWRIPVDKAEQAASQSPSDTQKAAAIVAKAVQVLGGDRYLSVRSMIGRGKYSVIKDNSVTAFQSFIDVIAYPDRERTEFRDKSGRTVQVNTGSTGWVFDGAQELIKIQNQGQVDAFKESVRVSLDNLLRGGWKNDAKLLYVGRRPASLGKRNDVVRLVYNDGLSIEFEFADDGLPQRSLYTHTNADSEQIKEEDRYAQFIDLDGIKAAFVIDHFTNGAQSSRINYESVEYNKNIPDSIFAKPSNAKEAKKDMKL